MAFPVSRWREIEMTRRYLDDETCNRVEYPAMIASDLDHLGRMSWSVRILGHSMVTIMTRRFARPGRCGRTCIYRAHPARGSP
jgi:S-adenosylmethionine:diacylglycerol 3-amino-3-carboxypropyl transferase